MKTFHFKKLVNELNNYGIGAIVVIGLMLYGLFIFFNYLQSKNAMGSYEGNSEMQSQYQQQAVNQQHQQPMHTNIQDPSELLPKDSNSQWGELNPNGSGNLQGVGLLSAGYHIGIDTVGQTKRNMTQDPRGFEPPNPQVDTGIWNRSTIEPPVQYRDPVF